MPPELRTALREAEKFWTGTGLPLWAGALGAAAILLLVLGIALFLRGRRLDLQKIILAPITLAILAAALVVGGLGFGYTQATSPEFCAGCHRGEISVILTGSHRKTGCHSCHDPGVVGAMARLAREGGRFLPVNPYLRRHRPALAVVRDDACLACHRTVSSGVVESGRLRVSHQEFLGASACADCHRDVAHRVRHGQNNVKTVCLACHDGQKAAGECRLCHRRDVGSINRLNMDDYRKVRLVEDRTMDQRACGRCHPEPRGCGDQGCHEPPATEEDEEFDGD
jgi:hypothetical protein